MTGPERGRATGQHEQPRQQASLAGCEDALVPYFDRCTGAVADLVSFTPAPARIDAAWPATAAMVEDASGMLAYGERVEFLTSGAWREVTCEEHNLRHDIASHCPECQDEYLRDKEGDDAYERSIE